MPGPSQWILSCFANEYPQIRVARFAGFALFALIIGVSTATAQTPTSSASPAPEKENALSDIAPGPNPAPAETPAASPVPHHGPKVVTPAKTMHRVTPAPAATPRRAGFGSMMPGVPAAAPSPSPARERKSKKNVAEKTASPVAKKNAAVASVKQATPTTSPAVVNAAHPAGTAHATSAPVKQDVPTTDPIAVRVSQPEVTTGAAAAPVEPPPPAEGPNATPVRQRAPATPAPVEQPASVAAPNAPPVQPPAPAVTTRGNLAASVWVNTETHVYHRAGSRYYGKTKKGKYMSEQEAITEGNRPAREWLPPGQSRQNQ